MNLEEDNDTIGFEMEGTDMTVSHHDKNYSSSNSNSNSNSNSKTITRRKTYWGFDVEQNPYITAMLWLLGLFFFFLFATIFYTQYEGWSVHITLYFLIVTISTVGYGYWHPTDDGSRAFTIFVIIIGVYMMFNLLTDVINLQLNLLSDYNKDNNKDNKDNKDKQDPNNPNSNSSSSNNNNNNNNNDEVRNAATLYAMYRRRVGAILVVMTITILLAGLFYSLNEDLTYITGLYFAIQTASTVGYGDIPVEYESTHIFTGFFIVFFTTGSIFSVCYIQRFWNERKNLEEIEKVTVSRKVVDFEKEFQGLDINEAEFIISMLKTNRKIFEEDVEIWRQKYRDLADKNPNKTVTMKELKVFEKKEHLEAREDEVILTENRAELTDIFRESLEFVSNSVKANFKAGGSGSGSSNSKNGKENISKNDSILEEESAHLEMEVEMEVTEHDPEAVTNPLSERDSDK